MALRAAPQPISALRGPERKQDVRGELADCKAERAAGRVEELVFIHRVRSDASRVIRLLVNEDLVAAASLAGGLVHASTRRLAQLAVPDEDDAA